jgi:ribosomal protein S18 acetylase RimI-like enzyme
MGLLISVTEGNAMLVRSINGNDWRLLKQVRLAALADAPTAFGVSYDAALKYSDAQWQERATAAAGPEFWLAFIGGAAVGMIGAGISQASKRYNLIGMWVDPQSRGAGIAARLVETVKTRAAQRGHDRIFLDVSPDNGRAAGFYLKQGFVFIDEWEPLASHPHIRVQTMVWTPDRDVRQATAGQGAVSA